MRISVHSKNCKKYQNKEENKMAKKKEQKDMMTWMMISYSMMRTR